MALTAKLEKNIIKICNNNGPITFKGKPCAFKRNKRGHIKDLRDDSGITIEFLKNELTRMLKDEAVVSKLILDLFNISDEDLAKWDTGDIETHEKIDDIEIIEPVAHEDEETPDEIEIVMEELEMENA